MSPDPPRATGDVVRSASSTGSVSPDRVTRLAAARSHAAINPSVISWGSWFAVNLRLQRGVSPAIHPRRWGDRGPWPPSRHSEGTGGGAAAAEVVAASTLPSAGRGCEAAAVLQPPLAGATPVSPRPATGGSGVGLSRQTPRYVRSKTSKHYSAGLCDAVGNAVGERRPVEQPPAAPTSSLSRRSRER